MARGTWALTWCSLLLPVALWAASASAAPCNDVQAKAAHRIVQQTEARLDRAVNATSAIPGMSGDVPAAVGTDIRNFKDALVEAADHRMACESSPAPRPQVVEAQLVAVLGANKPATIAGQDASASGLIVRVREAWGMPEWLLVRVGFPLGSCCLADDNMLLGYVHRDSGWRRVFRLQSGTYSEISGAWGDFFDYLVLPAQAGQARRIVIAHGRPWPMSCWSGFVIDVFEPGPDRDSVQRVFHVGHGYRRCRMKPELTRTTDGFELDPWLGAWGMPPSVMRKGLFRYRPQAKTYVRVQPVAFDPQGFVGAWIDAKWPEASHWSRPAARAGLNKTHSDLQNRIGFDWVEYGGVDGCPGNDYQVTFNLERIRLDKVLSKRMLRFMVRDDGGDVFTMLSSSSKADPACSRKVAMRQD